MEFLYLQDGLESEINNESSFDEHDEDWQRYKVSSWAPLHPVVKNWPLVGNYHYNVLLVLFYLVFVKIIGPWFMSNRRPYDLRVVLQIYNLSQIALSFYIFWSVLTKAWLNGYNLRCEPVDYSARGLPVARIAWLYYISKHIEFLDTVFFVLRKKDNQISTLHLIHHSGMPLLVGFGMSYTPGGHGTFFGLLNSLVHVVMYTYYFFAAFGPSVQKYLWWKNYLTQMQLVQFVLVFFHALQVLVTDCDFPKRIAAALCMFSLVMLVMFSQFYVTTYRKRKSGKATKIE